jgi:hypothetical protein
LARITGSGIQDRRVEPPRGLRLVATNEKRAIPDHRIEHEPLVGLGRVRSKSRAVAKVHLHRLRARLQTRHLAIEDDAQALVRLDLEWQRVRREIEALALGKKCARRTLELIAISLTRRAMRLPERR